MLDRAQLAERWGVSKSFIDKKMKKDRGSLPVGTRITSRIEKFLIQDVEMFEQERRVISAI
jgi:hypothetical protein